MRLGIFFTFESDTKKNVVLNAGITQTQHLKLEAKPVTQCTTENTNFKTKIADINTLKTQRDMTQMK